MKNRSKTYRLFSLFMAVLVAMSISFPSVLVAAYCDMDKQQESLKSEIAGEYCPQLEVHSAHVSHNHQKHDCDWTLSCAFEIEQRQIKAEAIPTITKTAKVFVVSVIQFIDVELTDTPTFFADLEINPHTVTSPIFLLNSVFLN